MNRFFVERRYISEGNIRITDSDDLHHLTRVLRLSIGEQLFVTDGEGRAYIAIVERIARTSMILKILDTVKNSRPEDRKVTISLAVAVPKNVHFENIVDKCTQLGVSQIIPLLTERTLVKKDVFEKKNKRLERVLVSAAKQSGVLFVPKLNNAVNFSEFLPSLSEYDLKLLPNLSDRSIALSEALSGFDRGRILLMVGPEGDFSEKEIRAASASGCLGVSLGESVLKVDTAAIAAVSFIKLFLGL